MKIQKIKELIEDIRTGGDKIWWEEVRGWPKWMELPPEFQLDSEWRRFLEEEGVLVRR